MNREQFYALLSKGVDVGSKAAADQAAHQSALAQLIKGKQLDLSNKKDEQANADQIQSGAEKREQDQALALQQNQAPGTGIHVGKFSLTPKDNTAKQTATNDREDKMTASETAAIHKMMDSMAKPDVDALKSGQQVGAILNDPNTMNKTALRIALTKAAGAGRISQFEVQNALGPESLYERGTDLVHSVTGSPEAPFTDAQRQQLLANHLATQAPHVQNVQKAMEAIRGLGPNLAPTLSKRGLLDSVMQSYTGPIDALTNSAQAKSDTNPQGLSNPAGVAQAAPKAPGLGALLGSKPAPTTPQDQPPMSFAEFKARKAAGQL